MSSRVGDDPPDDADSLIDDFGLYIGRAMGWPPMAGRAAGVLMLSESPMTMTQLQDALHASKGSMSETTRLLVLSGTVRRFKEPGSRHYVYEWRDDAWIGCLQHQIEGTTDLLALAENAQARDAALPERQRARLRDMQEFYTFMVQRLETLLGEYRALREHDDPGHEDARDRTAGGDDGEPER
ncbi:DNA-binding transcriptional regulator GbsR, MarR family [Prauserella alba]|uniref:DNA-binding transcriptional regulator GbsR, MarR family n=1 Tax=Prauserella alba TaxID=176898 RepID=A0ABP4G4U1_9PSEU|nr:DNA-binding transcriptional regulator GbsR, MarR family [Prauserella alba]